MYCVNCGRRLPEDAKVCDGCGKSVHTSFNQERENNSYSSSTQNATSGYSNYQTNTNDYYSSEEPYEPKPGGGFAIAALVLCILGVISCCIPYIAIPINIIGIICGILGLRSDRKTLAIVAIVICVVFLVFAIGFLILNFIALPYVEEWTQGYVYPFQ